MLPEQGSQSSVVDILEKVLDKGVVIAGDVRIFIADVELITIKIRLLIASIDKAREIGMDWWETDPYYSSKAKNIHSHWKDDIISENERLSAELHALTEKVEHSLLNLGDA